MMLSIFSYLSPFIAAGVAAGLTYFFNIKTHKKVTDLEKEKALNVTLSNLMDSIHYLRVLKSLFDILSEDRDKNGFPVHIIPSIMLKSDFLNDKSFYELKDSVAELKCYDSLIYFKLSGAGSEYTSFKSQFILPYMENPKLDKNFFKVGPNSFIDQIDKDLIDSVDLISREFSRRKGKKIRKYLSSMKVLSSEDIINKMEVEHYESIVSIIPDNEEKPSFEEYKDALNKGHLKESFKFQEDIILNGNLPDFLQKISKIKDLSQLSMEELQGMIKTESSNLDFSSKPTSTNTNK